jgi:hypothetical protein
VQLGQLAGEGEPDPQSALRLRFVVVDLREHVEHSLQCLGLQTHPILRDANFDLIARAAELQSNAASRWGVFGCVVEQIRGHLGDTRGSPNAMIGWPKPTVSKRWPRASISGAQVSIAT